MVLLHFRVRIIHITLLVLSAGLATAQEFPNRPIRIVTGAVGGGSDIAARIIAQGISGPLGQPVVVDNRAAIIMGPTVLKEKPDGHTMMLGGGFLWVQPVMTRSSYDVFKDFSPISVVNREVNLVVVHPSVPAKSIKELIALAKARPGELNYGTSGIGGSNHLAVEHFKSMAGVNLLAINYKGSAPALNGLLGGEVQVMFPNSGTATPAVKAGRLRAIAVTTAQPSALFPALPTVSASGVPGYEWVSISAMWVPVKTPAGIIQRLNQEIVRFLNTAEVKQRFLDTQTEVVASSPDELGAAVKAEIAKLEKVIREANIKLE